LFFNDLHFFHVAYPQASPHLLWKKISGTGNKVMHRSINIPADGKKIFPI
jgi:hypothetical protein